MQTFFVNLHTLSTMNTHCNYAGYEYSVLIAFSFVFGYLINCQHFYINEILSMCTHMYTQFTLLY